jgi:hypothetical protein
MLTMFGSLPRTIFPSSVGQDGELQRGQRGLAKLGKRTGLRGRGLFL